MEGGTRIVVVVLSLPGDMLEGSCWLYGFCSDQAALVPGHKYTQPSAFVSYFGFNVSSVFLPGRSD